MSATWHQIAVGTNGGGSQPPASFSIEGIAANGAVYLGWLSVQGETNYQVQRRLLGGSTFSNVGSATTNTFYNDATAIDGETYEYRVLGVGTSSTSNTVSLSPEFDLYSTTTVATPTNFHGFCVAGRRMHLTWRKGNEMDFVSYKIQYRIGTSGTFLDLTTITPHVSQYGIYTTSDSSALRQTESVRYFMHDLSGLLQTGLTSGQTIQYQIKAYLGDILQSAYSSAISVTVAGGYTDCTGDNLKASYDAVVATATSGICVRVTSSTTAPLAPITIRPGISIECQTGVTLQFTQSAGTNDQWYLALFKTSNSGVVDMNVEFKNVSINGGTYQGRAGWSMMQGRYMIFTGCTVTNTYWMGIGIGDSSTDSVITGCTLNEAGYGPPDTGLGDTWAEEGGAFVGNITLRGNTTNIQILFNTVNSLTRGYGVKQLINYQQTEPTTGNQYNLQTDTLGIGNVFNMGNRFWNNASPQFSWEIWACDSQRVYLGGNFFTNQVSLEHRNEAYNRSHRYSVKVWHNDFQVDYKAAVEISNHDLDIRYNFIDMRNVDPDYCEEIFGDYNQPSGAYYNTDNTIIAYNLVLCGTLASPNFITRRNQASNTWVYGNTYISARVPDQQSAGFYAFYNIRTYDSGTPLNTHSNLFIENNVIDIVNGSLDRRIVMLSTDAGGGGFTPYNTGQATITGTCSIKGNLYIGNVVLPPSGATLTGNEFVPTTTPQYVGTGVDKAKYRPLQTAGNMFNAGQKTGRKYNGTAPDRGCYQ